MASPRAIVQMRVREEARLSRTIRAMAELLSMPEHEVPQLLTPRVPNNDPNLKHVRFLDGVATIIERFLTHSEVDVEAMHQQAEEEAMAEHARPLVNTDDGPNIQATIGDPRMTNVGQGLAPPNKPAGIVPGMLEGSDAEVAEALDDVETLADLNLLREQERTRLGGARRNIVKLIDEREQELHDEETGNEVAEEHLAAVEERQTADEAELQKQADAAAVVQPDTDVASAAVVGLSPNRQLAPERPPAAQRQRASGRRARTARSG